VLLTAALLVLAGADWEVLEGPVELGALGLELLPVPVLVPVAVVVPEVAVVVGAAVLVAFPEPVGAASVVAEPEPDGVVSPH